MIYDTLSSSLFTDINAFLDGREVSFNKTIKGSIKIFKCDFFSKDDYMKTQSNLEDYTYWHGKIVEYVSTENNNDQEMSDWLSNRTYETSWMMCSLESMHEDTEFRVDKPYVCFYNSSMDDVVDIFNNDQSASKKWVELHGGRGLADDICGTLYTAFNNKPFETFSYCPSPRTVNVDPLKEENDGVTSTDYIFFYCREEQLIACLEFATISNYSVWVKNNPDGRFW